MGFGQNQVDQWCGNHTRTSPSDVSDNVSAFVAAYLASVTPDAPQRIRDFREVFNALRHLVWSSCSWLMLPNDVRQWPAAHPQT